MATEIAPGCTCGRCTAYRAPEGLCAGALAAAYEDIAEGAQEAGQSGDHAAAAQGHRDAGVLKGLLTGIQPRR